MKLLVTNGAERLPDGFLALPAQVYGGDPQWIPESSEDTKRVFSAENSWFERGEAACFCVPDRVRSAVFINPEMVIDGIPSAFFGYFESVGDAQAEALTFAAMESWAMDRGAKQLFGPINFSTFGDYRLRVHAEPGARTFQSEPYNPPYYPKSLESLNYNVNQEYLVQIADTATSLAVIQRSRALLQNLQADGYRFEPLSVELWMKNLKTLHGLVDQTFALNFAYTPISYDSFVRACGEAFVRKACPHTSVLVFGPEGDIVGFAINYPHYGPLLTQSAGAARVPHANLNFAVHAPLLEAAGHRVVLLKTYATAPDHRQKGLMTAMGTYGVLQGHTHYDVFFAAMIRSDNPSRRAIRETHQHERWYALYSKDLTA